MHLDELIAHCLGRRGATEETPFGPEVLVYKVGGKLFALTNPDDVPPEVNLKCDPDAPSSCRTATKWCGPDTT